MQNFADDSYLAVILKIIEALP